MPLRVQQAVPFFGVTNIERSVRWYVDGIEPMLAGRAPLDGPVSNIASWNYPMSVLVHAMLVQTLAGNGS